MPVNFSKVPLIKSSVISFTLPVLLVGSLIGCQPKNTNENTALTSENTEHDHYAHHDDSHKHTSPTHHDDMREGENIEHHHGTQHEEHHHDEQIYDSHHSHTDMASTHDNHAEHSDHEGHHHEINRILFSCSPDKQIGAFYHTDTSPQTAHLLIDGIEYDLTQTKNSHQQVFVSEYGFDVSDDTHGMMWQIEDDEAVLSTINANDVKTNVAELKPEQTLFTCHKNTQSHTS